MKFSPRMVVFLFLYSFQLNIAVADDVISITPPDYKEFREIARGYGIISHFTINENGLATAKMTTEGNDYYINIPASDKEACRGTCDLFIAVCNQHWQKPQYDDFTDWSKRYFTHIEWTPDNGTCLEMDLPAYDEPLTEKKLESMLGLWTRELEKFRNRFVK
jgi:hypothetical protein